MKKFKVEVNNDVFNDIIDACVFAYKVGVPVIMEDDANGSKELLSDDIIRYYAAIRLGKDIDDDVEREYQEIARISWAELNDFFDALGNEFTLSAENLSIIKNLMCPTFYSYKVSLRLQEEANYESKAHYDLDVSGWADWDSESHRKVAYKMRFCWTTGSGHVLLIEGANDDDADEPYEHATYTVSIGTDESSNFYETVKRICNHTI